MCGYLANGLMALGAIALVLMALPGTLAQTKLLLITESVQSHLNNKFEEGIKRVQDSTGDVFDIDPIVFKRKESDARHTDMCSKLADGTYSAVVDMAWGGWIKGRKTANELGIPYIRVESANHLFVQAADDFLRSQDSVDAALIFETQEQLDQSLYYIIGNSFLRIIGAHQADPGAYDR